MLRQVQCCEKEIEQLYFSQVTTIETTVVFQKNGATMHKLTNI